MNVQDQINAFLAGRTFAVIGASPKRTKYGNKVLRAYLQNGKTVYVVHPIQKEIEGVACFRRLADLPEAVDGLSIITPPRVTEQVVEQAAAVGIRSLWMQPGAESATAIERAESLGMSVIAGGPCILVALRFHEEDVY